MNYNDEIFFLSKVEQGNGYRLLVANTTQVWWRDYWLIKRIWRRRKASPGNKVLTIKQCDLFKSFVCLKSVTGSEVMYTISFENYSIWNDTHCYQIENNIGSLDFTHLFYYNKLLLVQCTYFGFTKVSTGQNVFLNNKGIQKIELKTNLFNKINFYKFTKHTSKGTLSNIVYELHIFNVTNNTLILSVLGFIFIGVAPFWFWWH